MTPPQGLNFYIVIYREMLKKSSSQEPLLSQFQSNLVGNMSGGWEFRFVQIKRLLGQNKDNFDKSSKIFFSGTTYWLECIDV